MKTDLKTQLSGYGQYHRESQDPVGPEDALVGLAGKDRETPNYVLRRVVVAVAAALVITLFVGIPALLFSTEDQELDTPAATTPLDVPESTSPAVSIPDVPTYEGYAMVEELNDGSLVGIAGGSIWRSEDGGESWSVWYENFRIDVMIKAPDGAILAVRDSTLIDESYGPGSTVNHTPEMHRFDQALNDWSVIQLPRPEFPNGDTAEIDPSETTCQIGGFHSWVSGSSFVVGDRIVLLGDQRVTADGICEEDFQFLWTSSNGVDWNLVPDIEANGYLAKLLWTGDHYVGIGSERPSYIGGGGPVPMVWTSDDLVSWKEQPLDLSELPEEALMRVISDGFDSFSGQAPFDVIQDSNGIVVSFDVLRYRPGLDESITDIEVLEAWHSDAGLVEQQDPSLGELLASMGIDFPLDSDELDNLQSFFNVKEPYGTLTLSSEDGVAWAADYAGGDTG